jgi:hypothetical protein
MIDKSIPEKIRRNYPPGTRIVLDSMNTPEARKEKYEYMRMKKKIEEQMLSTPRRKVASSYWDAY